MQVSNEQIWGVETDLRDQFRHVHRTGGKPHMKKLLRLAAVVIPMVLVAPAAEANVGVPIIAVTLPGMLIALLPIIAVETYVLIDRMGFSLWRSVELVSVGNLVSTVVGIPVTWLLLTLLSGFTTGGTARDIASARGKFLAVTLDAPWVAPYETEDMNWMVPAACLSMLVPFFFASWWIEYAVARWLFDREAAGDLWDAVFIGNMITYGIIAGLIALITVLQYRAVSANVASRTATGKQRVKRRKFEPIVARIGGRKIRFERLKDNRLAEENDQKFKKAA